VSANLISTTMPQWVSFFKDIKDIHAWEPLKSCPHCPVQLHILSSTSIRSIPSCPVRIHVNTTS
jgi:hypothetical protein